MTRRDALIGLLAETVEAVTGVVIDPAEPERTLEDYGIDSLDRLELLMEVEERLKVRLNDRDLRSDATVGAIAAFVEQAEKEGV